MKTFSHRIAPFFLVLSLACSGGIDGDPSDDDGDRGPADGDATDQDGGGDGGLGDDDGDGDGGHGDGDGMQSMEPCPAPALGADQIEVYAEGHGSAWSSYAFNGTLATETTNVCSGGSALKDTVVQYDGIAFSRTSAIAAVHLSLRVYVSEDSTWTIAAVPPAGDAHCYRLPFPTTCGQFTAACGADQDVTPCLLHWETGWQSVDLDIPSSTATVQQIMFENQTDPTAASITLIVDDLRLTQP